MNSKKAALFSAAAIFALSAAACGKVEKESSDVALDIHTATSAVDTTSEGDEAAVTTAVSTTSAVSTKSGETTTKKGYSAKPSGSTHTTAAPQEPVPAQTDPVDPDPQTPDAPDPTEPPTEPPTDPPTEPADALPETTTLFLTKAAIYLSTAMLTEALNVFSALR